MPANTTHEAFLQPENENGIIWKYLSFERLLSIIITKKIIFSRIDSFEDEFEGALEESKFKNSINYIDERIVNGIIELT